MSAAREVIAVGEWRPTYAERREHRMSSTMFLASVMAGSSRAKYLVCVIRLPPEKI
jgi:hypothetical protein